MSVRRPVETSPVTDLRADLRRYPPRPWLREQSVWAIAIYRFGRWADGQRGPKRFASLRIYWLLHRLVETITGVGISRGVVIGGGLRIHHFGGIFVAEGVRIGTGCTLRQGVSIGNRVEGGPVPMLGDRVDLGAYAQVLGGVVLGDDCRIGALSLVLDDVPAGATAVGIPARIHSAPDER